ncbi:unnamed protein product, partial [Meganyctiphanes norvegica]
VLSRASSVLYSATRQRAYFRDVKVIVPQGWNPARCPRPITTSAVPLQPPAIHVGQSHPVYGHAPWTDQVGGCGEPGQAIHLSEEYLANNRTTNLGDPGRVVVHEWAKYRWGVFEEYGHLGDPLYPPFYLTAPHHHKPTGCSNIDVHGDPSSCDPEQESCVFSPSVGGNDGVTSSLMYLHHLPHVTQFCDGDTHNPNTPTKQNALCTGRPVWDVIKEHPDFANGSNEPGPPSRTVSPIFSYIKPGIQRYVIVVEDTHVMNVQKRWEFLRKAVRKLLVYDIPPGSKLGVVRFGHTATTKLPLTTIPDMMEQRQRLATSSLPRNPSTVGQSQKCIICGLEEAVRMLEVEGASAEGGAIFLVTSGTPQPLTPYEMNQLGKVVTEKGVRVVPIIYPITDRNPQPAAGVEYLAQISGTQSFAVVDEGIGSDSKVSMMVSLMDALYSALRIFLPEAKDLPLIVHTQEFPGGIGSISQGAFTIDESLGGEVRFSLTYYDLGHVGNMINLIDPQGNVLDTLNTQEEDGDVNMIFVTVRDVMVGQWRYRVENKADSHQSLYIQVMATPRTNNNSLHSGLPASSSPSAAVTLSSWLSTNANTINVTEIHKPVKVYAKVSVGSAGVIGGKVEAVLQRLGLNSTGSPYSPLVFTLYDNGNGDADITKHDGVYSRYLPVHEAVMDGRFKLLVTLSDNNAQAMVITAPRAQRHTGYGQGLYMDHRDPHFPHLTPVTPDVRCCGSVVPYTSSRPTGMVSRTLTVGILDLVGASYRPASVFSHVQAPPSKIGNFQAEVNAQGQHVTFTWEAPGNIRDYGTASHYEVILARDAVSAIEGNGEPLKDWGAPLLSGTPSSHMVVRWGRHDSVFYVAIRAVSHASMPGSWSNVARVYMPHPSTTTEINMGGSTMSNIQLPGTVSELGVTMDRPTSTLATKDILVIVGATCGLLLIILVLALYYLVVVTRRRNRQEKKSMDVLDPSMTNSQAGLDGLSETDSIAKPPPPDNTMTMGEMEQSTGRPLSPIQSWPVSTLLAEHERRTTTDGMDGSIGIQPDLGDIGVPYIPQHIGSTQTPMPPNQFFYHTPNGHYIEDSLAMDSGSLTSTQPSDSLLIYKVDSTGNDTIRPPSSMANPTPTSWDPSRSGHPTKVPPPTPPKPTLSAHLTLGGVSAATMGAAERKRRNVTQV